MYSESQEIPNPLRSPNVHQKRKENFENFEIWRRMEKISWTDRVKNEKVLHSQGGEEYHTYSKKKGG